MPWFLTSLLSKKTVEGNPQYKNLDRRTFGFYEHFRNAYMAVSRNYCDMSECLYDYLVMEYMEEGIHPEVHAEYWWEWNEETNCWKFLRKRPEEFLGIINFALG